MRVLAWNIQQGGANRASAIVEAVRAADPDVIVMTEVRPTSGPMLKRLQDCGWANVLTGSLLPRIGGVALLARGPLVPVPMEVPVAFLPGRWIEADLPEFNVRIAGVYGPLHKEPYDDFWRSVCGMVRRRLEIPFLLAGDLNTGQSIADAPAKNLFCSAHFDQLQQIGLVDLWRAKHGVSSEYSYHHRLRGGAPGSGFRLDHALGSTPLAARLTSAAYDHSLREGRVSDHSPLLVQFT